MPYGILEQGMSKAVRRLHLVALIVAGLNAYAAAGCSIDGRIVDAKTFKPVFLVNVFLANTTLGTSSGEDGGFCVRDAPIGTYDVVFHHVGYESRVIHVELFDSTARHLEVELEPKVLKGESVAVSARTPKEWRRQLKVFSKEFLGESKNAKKCMIVNPEVLNFNRDAKTGGLLASTDSVLRVSNAALGYEVFILLKEFSSSEEHLRYTLYPFFQELPESGSEDIVEWRKARHKTYIGSFKHFLSALARNRLEEEKFIVYEAVGSGSHSLTMLSDRSVSVDSTWVSDTRFPGIKRVHFKGYRVVISLHIPAFIEKKKDRHEFIDFYEHAYVRMKTDEALVDTLGNCLTYNAFVTSGFWQDERIADMLPLGYSPGETARSSEKRKGIP
jgi:hypothetical protein